MRKQLSCSAELINSVEHMFLDMHTHLNNSKRTLILPCSGKKLPNADIAFHLYQGSGYLSIVKKYKLDELLNVFNVFFLSAKYGLIPATEFVEPYDFKITKGRVLEFSTDSALKSKAKHLLRNTNCEACLYLILPKVYLEALRILCGNTLDRFTNVQTVSGGILSHRRQLNEWLKAEFDNERYRSELSKAVLVSFNDTLPQIMNKHVISIGDEVRPWIMGVGNSAIYSPIIRIASIRCHSSGVLTIEDTTGEVWSGYSVAAGIKRFGFNSHN